MLRVSPCLLLKLRDALTQVQKVWNLDFAGEPTTHKLNFHETPPPSTPFYHIMELDGTIVKPAEEPKISKETLIKMMKVMLQQHTMDNILLEAQRQGRISFYMTSFGEEATVVGTAAGIEIQDEVFLQYREAALLSYRGYTISEFIAQCMGNIENELKGRQMPIHYGSRRLNVHMVSSPLATQIPHAAGAGYAFRLENEKENNNNNNNNSNKIRIATVIFGDGASSEGDFHAGINFAATVGSHTLFIVRNNAYAISTPTHSQYKGDGIISRGISYGIPSIRVDGNDILAVYQSIRRAREIILSTNRPVLVEAMTYRVSHHSSSDDSGVYRSREEIKFFNETFSPITRFEKYLTRKGLWGLAQSQEVIQQTREIIFQEIRRQEKLPKWPIQSMHDDVLKEMTPEMRQAQRELEEHYERNKSKYNF